MPRHTCPSTNKVAPAGYATVNFRGWKAAITDFGKWQKNPSEHNLQERQSSTSSIPYGECIVTLPVEPQIAQSQLQWREGGPSCSAGPTATGSRCIERGYRVRTVQVWSILLTRQIIVVGLVSAHKDESSRLDVRPRNRQGGDGGGFGTEDGLAQRGGDPLRLPKAQQLIRGPAAFGADSEGQRFQVVVGA